jgi:hypothetical protein
MTQPATFPTGWVFDQRGDGRGAHVSAHVDAGFLVLSTWKSDVCVATVQVSNCRPDSGTSGTRPIFPTRP